MDTLLLTPPPACPSATVSLQKVTPVQVVRNPGTCSQINQNGGSPCVNGVVDANYDAVFIANKSASFEMLFTASNLSEMPASDTLQFEVVDAKNNFISYGGPISVSDLNNRLTTVAPYASPVFFLKASDFTSWKADPNVSFPLSVKVISSDPAIVFDQQSGVAPRGMKINIQTISPPQIGFVQISYINQNNTTIRPYAPNYRTLLGSTESSFVSRYFPVPDSSGISFVDSKVTLPADTRYQGLAAEKQDIVNIIDEARVTGQHKIGVVPLGYFPLHNNGVGGTAGITDPFFKIASLVREDAAQAVTHELAHTYNVYWEDYIDVPGGHAQYGLHDPSDPHQLNYIGYDAANRNYYSWPINSQIPGAYVEQSIMGPGSLTNGTANPNDVLKAWIDDETYRTILYQMIKESSVFASASTVVVSGILQSAGSFSGSSSYYVAKGTITPSEPGGDVTIATLDVNNNIVDSVSISSNFSTLVSKDVGAPSTDPSADPGMMPISVELPRDPSDAYLEVSWKGKVLYKTSMNGQLIFGILDRIPIDAYTVASAQDTLLSTAANIASLLNSGNPNSASGQLNVLANQIKKLVSPSYPSSPDGWILTRSQVLQQIQQISGNLNPPADPNSGAVSYQAGFTIKSNTNGYVTFDPSWTLNPNNVSLAYQWDFGDGSTSNLSGVVAHQYSTAGQYTVRLTVTDSTGVSSTSQQVITVTQPQPPTAKINVTPSESGYPPFTAAFDSSSSTDPQNSPLTCLWNFGDGQTSNQCGSVSHVFTTAVSYTVTLTVTDAANLSGSASTSITVIKPTPPVVMLNASPLSGLIPVTTNFDASLSTDPQGLALSYSWNFGDGTTLTNASSQQSHQYTTAGSYTATVTVTDSGGASSTSQVTVNVIAPQPPIAVIKVSSNKGAVPFTPTLDSSASSDPQGLALTYQWNFGDGSTSGILATGGQVSHTYAKAGQYTVTLTVTDSVNLSSSATTVVTVNNLSPVAILKVTSASKGTAPFTATFDSSGSSDPQNFALTYQWNYGDGTTSAVLNAAGQISHTYTKAGQYTVTLTVTASDNLSSSATAIITVNNAPPVAVVQVTSASNGAAPFTASFDASGSSDPQNQALTYSWDFGDGTTSTSGATVSHEYTSPGTYTVTLTVTNSSNLSLTATASITVTQPSLSLSIGVPVQNQVVSDTVEVIGSVNLPATIQINGQSVSTTPSSNGATFDVTIPTPIGGVITVVATSGSSSITQTVQVIPAFTSLAAGNNAVCAVRQGRLFCWGLNQNGDLGVGDTNERTIPTAVASMQTGVTTVSVGLLHGCAIKSGGLYCWGWNGVGQVGIGGTSGSVLNPSAVVNMNAGVTKVAAGTLHTCAIKSGLVYCWGSNSSGEIGIGSTGGNIATPVHVTLPESVIDVATGQETSCAIGQSGALYCWGRNDYGQIGDGTTTNRPSPVQISMGSGVTVSKIALSISYNYACAITNVDVRCWGQNDNGELGNGTQTASSVPTIVTGLQGNTFTDITTGGETTCIVASGAVRCWGTNAYGVLDTSSHVGMSLVPVPAVNLASGVSIIRAALNYNCAIQNGLGLCWGRDQGGNLGTNVVGDNPAPSPIVDPDGL